MAVALAASGHSCSLAQEGLAFGRFGSRHEDPLTDRIFKLLVLSLGVLLIFLVGFFVALLNEDVKPPAITPAPAPRVEAAPPKADQNPNDLTTKRVKTIIVRPEDVSSTPTNP